jgi:hypothetical protein
MTPWQETAALRDFDPAYVRSGSNSLIRRCPLNVRFAPESGRVADIGRRLKRARRRYSTDSAGIEPSPRVA